MNKTSFVRHITQCGEYEFSWYEVAGMVESNDLPVLLMVHGIGTSARYWFSVAERMKEKYRMILIDRIGYGESQGILINSLEETVSTLEQFIEKLYDGKEIIFIGHSFGGLIGLKMALGISSIDTFILISAFDKFFIDEIWFQKAKGNQELMQNILNGFMPDCDNDIKEVFKREAFAIPHKVIRNDFQVCIDSDLRGEIQNIKKKIYLVSGKEDKVISIRKSRNLHKKIENSTLIELDGANHNVVIEKPDVVAEILDFCVRTCIERKVND